MSSSFPKEPWFEVTSDLLFLDGHKFRRGDLLSASEVGDRAAEMLQLGMIQVVAANARAA
jgi:hypothetical protein